MANHNSNWVQECLIEQQMPKRFVNDGPLRSQALLFMQKQHSCDFMALSVLLGFSRQPEQLSILQ
jgi:hypothetical protein